MEPLRLKARQLAEEKIESWDDGDFELDVDDIPFRGCGSTNGQSNGPPSRRDSHSSVMSLRSDLESMPGEERHVHLPGDDEQSTLEAIAAATKAGIPLPKNVPSSALMGGTIKRLGGRKVKKIIQDDWENDIELPDSPQPLRIKLQDASKFPDALRQVSGGSQNSPSKPSSRPSTLPSIIKDDERRRESGFSSTSGSLTGAAHLDKFRDNDDDDLDFFGDGFSTIKVSKTRPPRPISLITPPTPQKDEKPTATAPDEDFEHDFELPSDGKLKLSMRKNIPKTPSSHADDLDWGEGSLGTRFGGTRRDGRSYRSSSASALSPSVSSSFTAESEDDTFDGLVLPSGPVDFEERLSRQRKSRSPVRSSMGEETPPTDVEKDDILSGLEIGDGEIFDAGKLTLHRNIRVNAHRPASPARPKTAVAITFTNKTVQSRLPRPSHERAHSMLEPVSESGGPIPSRSRRPQSRLGHSSQSSVTSLPTPTTISPSHSLLPGTLRKREIGNRSSLTSLRNEPTTTSSQLLRFKRSLPAMRAGQSPAKPNVPRYDRPSSRTENNRPPSGLRPKTPVDRTRPVAEMSASQARKPFLPAGVSNTQSHHVATKTSRVFRRHDSDNSIELRSHSRTISRSAIRSPSPRRHRTAAQIAQSGVRGEFYQGRPRHFGDGHELDGFDDLPTSAHAEANFIHQPAKAPLRNKIYQNVLPDRMISPSPGPYSPPSKVGNTPHFARDTTASRIARETSLAQRAPSTGALAPLTSQRVAQLSSRGNLALGVPQTTVRSKKHRKPPQLKPHLITNMNKHNVAKHEKGMYYNPQTHRWEGNENVLGAFDPPVSTPSTASVPSHLREKEATTPRPALITNITGTKGVQVVKGMVFDPQNMCWLKLGAQGDSKAADATDPMEGFDALEEDDDVFKDIPDLEDLSTADTNDGAQGRTSDVRDDWLVGEEFDVGPEFVRRQREEEDRWRKKCEKWVGTVERDRDASRWAIRDLLVFQRAAQ
ncbi:hypothetical protein SODALDRAFT_355749 [Sodiomyces alkalinus F11]|uniref:Cytokinesis regulator n=1 Tax=Sodiomyces alkalinus (strain CBS 110278 / VKM F-3762 / F11) TaxID=1314773 RepID=A0A3N2Q9W7_SODAK|nr:hypothetical protein SODALDRAFT_355749 [Sodiomyces alkalinus F11]ROT43536.1 hypothetical protein SODALDRAFT_355749 [Sodiomyces alkalinus F11]